MRPRPAAPEDAAIARIYYGGIEERVATFETRRRTAGEIRSRFGGRHPMAEGGGDVVAFAATSEYRPRGCHAGVAESSVYADRAAMGASIPAAERAVFWKLVSRVFVENGPSRGPLRSAGLREVGVYERHARLNGTWRDVVIVEPLPPNL